MNRLTGRILRLILGEAEARILRSELVEMHDHRAATGDRAAAGRRYRRELRRACLRTALTRLRYGRIRDESVVMNARRSRKQNHPDPGRPERNLRFTITRDIRHTTRMLMKSPLFSLTAILCMGIGIGANVVCLPFLKGVLLDPLPYEQPDRLIHCLVAEHQAGYSRMAVSYPDFEDFRSLNRTFDDMGATRWGALTLTGREEPERIMGAWITHNLPALLGREPVLGRSIRPEEDRPGSQPVVLVSEDLWRRRFRADPELIGESIQLDGIPHTVIGVMPADFHFPSTALVWMPLQGDPHGSRGSYSLSVIGRMNEGIDLDQARNDLNEVARRINAAHPDLPREIGAVLETMQTMVKGDVRPAALLFQGVVLFILLLVGANLAGILLVRGTARSREIAIRATLGAGRGRIFQLLITESMLIALAGGGVGLLLGWLGQNLLLAAIRLPIPPHFDFSIDLTVLAILTGLTALCGVLFGLFPALDLSRSDLAPLLNSESTRSSAGSRTNRFRSCLVVGEIALTLTLLTGTTLLAKGFLSLKQIDQGFETENLLTAPIPLAGPRYEEDHQPIAFHEDLCERLTAIPGIVSAAATSEIPDGFLGLGAPVFVEGSDPPEGPFPPAVTHQIITPDYFTVLGITPLAGRSFEYRDRAGAGPEVAIVNEAFVERWFPEADPIGRRLAYWGPPDRDEDWIYIVGVVPDIHNRGFGQPIRPAVYRPYAQSPLMSRPAQMQLLLRTGTDPIALAETVRTEIRAIDPGIPLPRFFTLEQALTEENWEQHLFMVVFGVFSVIALILTVVGVYGVVAYSVEKRLGEIGIRSALGAGPGDIITMIMRQGAGLTALGLMTGLILSMALMKFVSSMAFGVATTGPVLYAIATGTITGAMLLATYLPVRRATRLDPAIILQRKGPDR